MNKNITRILKILAALIWYIGGYVLLSKGISLIKEAILLKPDLFWHWFGLVVGIALGILKAVFIFSKSIHRNMDRIESLENPKIWNFYSLKFFFALAIMITTGALLSRAAHGIYPMLIAVGGLDLSLAVALMGSGIIYLKRW